MKKRRVLFFVAVLISTVSVVVSAQEESDSATCENVTGMWQNQLNSTMIISHINSRTGLIQGCYCSPSGTQGEWFRITGWTNSQEPQEGKDNIIPVSWSVRWGDYGSITAWSGYCFDAEDGTPTISAQWDLVRSNADQRWSHRMTDTDTFMPASQSSCGNPPPDCQ